MPNEYPDLTVDGYILTTTAARILGVSANRVKVFYREGRLPRRKRGSMNETPLADVLALAKIERRGGWPKGRKRKPAGLLEFTTEDPTGTYYLQSKASRRHSYKSMTRDPEAMLIAIIEWDGEKVREITK